MSKDDRIANRAVPNPIPPQPDRLGEALRLAAELSPVEARAARERLLRRMREERREENR